LNNVEQFEELAAVNSELRFITLELMKIAASKNQPFEDVLKEFTQNVFKLKTNLSKECGQKSKKNTKQAS